MFNYKPQTKSKPILIIEESSLYYKCLVEHIPNREIRSYYSGQNHYMLHSGFKRSGLEWNEP